MKLSDITEGIVSTSRGRIIDVKNEIADMLVTALSRMGYKPDAEYADSDADDAMIYIDMGGHTVMIQVISDDDIQIQLPEPLAELLGVPDYIKLGDPANVKSILQKIRSRGRQ